MKPRVRQVMFRDLPEEIQIRLLLLAGAQGRLGGRFWLDGETYKNWDHNGKWYYMCRHDDSWWEEL